MPPQGTTSANPLTWPRDECGTNLPPMAHPPKLKEGGVLGIRLLRPSAVDLTTGVALATLVFTVFSIPVLPLRRFRVLINAADQPCFFGTVPLRAIDRFAQIPAALAIVLAIYSVVAMSANQQKIEALRSAIKAARTEVQTMEWQLQTMDSELGTLKRQIEDFSQQIETMESAANLRLPVDQFAYRTAIANHNSLVPLYNQKLDERNALYEKYEASREAANQLINEYKSLGGR